MPDNTLTETADWIDGIYQIETDDPVVGGPDGVSNRQGKELACRTAYLRSQLAAAANALAAHEASRNHPAATTDAKGMVELATPDETLAGEDATRAVTPADLKAALEAATSPGYKAACRVATTAAIALAGLQTIDGVAVAAGDRVLVRAQASGVDNGIYVAAAGDWARAADAVTGKLVPGALVPVTAGTLQAGSIWILATAGDIEVGTTSIRWVPVGGDGTVGAHRNLRAVVAAASSTITLYADEVVCKTALAGSSYATSFPGGLTLNLATVGAGGMDSGVAPASGIVAIYEITNLTTGDKALLGINASAAVAPEVYGGAYMPAGYTASALVSVWPTDSKGKLKIGIQRGRHLSFPYITALTTSTPQGSAAPLSLASIIPLNAVHVGGAQGVMSGASASMNAAISADSALTGWQYFSVNAVAGSATWELDLAPGSRTIYYTAVGFTTSYAIFISSYAF